jgi:glycosyltransferase involved in cell wall biosynthesis
VLTAAPAVDVIIPTYRRPGHLVQCLGAIAAQAYPATRVIVVVRVDDDATRRAVRESSVALRSLEIVDVQTAGVVAAMTAGVAASTAPVIAFTDDDARPRRDWLDRISGHLDDPTVGGVGGRDVVPGQERPLTTLVGTFTRLGRLVGNHHLGAGPPREVDVLKGVNMAFRAEALALPAPGVLRGDGAEVDFEVLTCAWARQQGWRLVYDPALLVDHVGGPREGADQRDTPGPQATFDAAYNSMVAIAILDGNVPRRHLAYPLIVGSHDRPGVLRSIVALIRAEWEVLTLLGPALRGRLTALRALRVRNAAATSPVVSAASLREPR